MFVQNLRKLSAFKNRKDCTNIKIDYTNRDNFQLLWLVDSWYTQLRNIITHHKPLKSCRIANPKLIRLIKKKNQIKIIITKDKNQINYCN